MFGEELSRGYFNVASNTKGEHLITFSFIWLPAEVEETDEAFKRKRIKEKYDIQLVALETNVRLARSPLTFITSLQQVKPWLARPN